MLSLPRIAAALVLSASVARGAGEPALRFSRDIRPILSDRCFLCHGPDAAHREAGLRLDEAEAALAPLKSGRTAIVPGNPDDSELIRRVESTDPDLRMPPPDSHLTVSTEEVALLRRWIQEGAEYEPHWSLIPPVQEQPPAVPAELQGRVRNEIDAFVFPAAAAAGLAMAPEASPEALARRAALVLTGLPPPTGAAEEFLHNPTDEAWGRYLDRLLESRAFAERMALDWLDAARYADTYGYQADRTNHLWPWRDWVVKAFASNMPYDRFLTCQIAGDLLPDAGRDGILATAFNRLHRMTNEGGSVPEEFRIEGVADRVNTFGSAILGLTLECARCHDHKYDPITIREYYQLGAFFENIDEFGLYAHFNDAEPTPSLTLWKEGDEERHRRLMEEIGALEQQLRRIAEESADEAEAGDPPLPEPQDAFTFDGPEGYVSRIHSGRSLARADDPAVVPGRSGEAVKFDGDNGLRGRGDVATFGRYDPFTFSFWIHPGEYRPGAMVLHRSAAEQDAARQGYELLLDDGFLTLSLIHFWPGNAAQVRAEVRIPAGKWTHVAAVSDGSGRAAGLQLYADGVRLPCTVVRDCLTRDIGSAEFGIASRFRDTGFREGAIDELVIYDIPLTESEIRRLAGSGEPYSGQDRKVIRLRDSDGPWREARARLQKLRAAEDELMRAQPAIMVMREMHPRRQSYVRLRGVYDAPGEPVEPGVPACLPPLPDSMPADRLALARWLTSPNHPLTARVYVNRVWQMLFGKGLAPATNDLGSQSRLPSHPALLDWLACRFRDGGWNVRDLVRYITSSSVFRLSAVPDPASRERDPRNTMLSWYPRHRLPAEFVRDQALAVSGLLQPFAGGPSVRPYQPAGLWEESGTGAKYEPDHGPDLWRRSIYTFIKRTAPPANMLAFDSHAREVCTVKRETTNTPMQALVLLNDPQFVEAARVLAANVLSRIPEDPGARLEAMFHAVCGRSPSTREMSVMLRARAAQIREFTASPDNAAAFVRTGEAPVPGDIPVSILAAETAVAQMLMSSDEFLTVP